MANIGHTMTVSSKSRWKLSSHRWHVRSGDSEFLVFLRKAGIKSDYGAESDSKNAIKVLIYIDRNATEGILRKRLTRLQRATGTYRTNDLFTRENIFKSKINRCA